MSDRQIFTDDKGSVLYGRSEGDLEIHVDGVWGFTRSGATAKVNFYTRALNTDGDNPVPGERREVAVRLAMSIDNFISVARYLNKQADDIESELLTMPPELQKALDEFQASQQEPEAPPKKKRKSPAKKKAPSRSKRPAIKSK